MTVTAILSAAERRGVDTESNHLPNVDGGDGGRNKRERNARSILKASAAQSPPPTDNLAAENKRDVVVAQRKLAEGENEREGERERGQE